MPRTRRPQRPARAAALALLLWLALAAAAHAQTETEKTDTERPPAAEEWQYAEWQLDEGSLLVAVPGLAPLHTGPHAWYPRETHYWGPHDDSSLSYVDLYARTPDDLCQPMAHPHFCAGMDDTTGVWYNLSPPHEHQIWLAAAHVQAPAEELARLPVVPADELPALEERYNFMQIRHLRIADRLPVGGPGECTRHAAQITVPVANVRRGPGTHHAVATRMHLSDMPALYTNSPVPADPWVRLADDEGGGPQWMHTSLLRPLCLEVAAWDLTISFGDESPMWDWQWDAVAYFGIMRGHLNAAGVRRLHIVIRDYPWHPGRGYIETFDEIYDANWSQAGDTGVRGIFAAGPTSKSFWPTEALFDAALETYDRPGWGQHPGIALPANFVMRDAFCVAARTADGSLQYDDLTCDLYPLFSQPDTDPLAGLLTIGTSHTALALAQLQGHAACIECYTGTPGLSAQLADYKLVPIWQRTPSFQSSRVLKVFQVGPWPWE